MYSTVLYSTYSFSGNRHEGRQTITIISNTVCYNCVRVHACRHTQYYTLQCCGKTQNDLTLNIMTRALFAVPYQLVSLVDPFQHLVYPQWIPCWPRPYLSASSSRAFEVHPPIDQPKSTHIRTHRPAQLKYTCILYPHSTTSEHTHTHTLAYILILYRDWMVIIEYKNVAIFSRKITHTLSCYFNAKYNHYITQLVIV